MLDENLEIFQDSKLLKKVSENEFVIRFLKDSNQFSTTGVKHQAFTPKQNKSTGRLEVSVFRYQNESLEYWRERSLQINSKIPYGYAKLKVVNVRSLDLDVEADDTPPAHANIIKWPIYEDNTINKAKQTNLLQALAHSSEKVLYDF